MTPHDRFLSKTYFTTKSDNIFLLFKCKEIRHRMLGLTHMYQIIIGSIELKLGLVIRTIKYQSRNYFPRKHGRLPFPKNGHVINLLFNM
jgi:hypothetical protein